MKLLRKNNSYLSNKRSNASIYPVLNNNIGNNNNNNISQLIKGQVNSQKNYVRTTSAFFDRNYNNYLVKIYRRNNSLNRSVLKVNQLNTLLYRLKNYYNEIKTYNGQKLERLNSLKKELNTNELKIKNLQDFQDIDLTEEKISIKNFNELKLSKEEIEKKLFILIEEKNKIEYSLKNQEEYNRTLEYMLEDEQTRLFTIKKESLEILEKINNLNRYQKIVQSNMNINDKEEEKFLELNNKIDNDLNIVQKVEFEQNLTNDKIKYKIYLKENEVKILEERIKKLKGYKNNDLKIAKDELNVKIENAKEFEKKRISDEKKCIDIINCLYLIQKYLLDENDYDKNKLVQSEEYKLLMQLNNGTNIKMKTKSNFFKKEENKNNYENIYSSGGDLNKESRNKLNSQNTSCKNNKNSLFSDSVEGQNFNKTTKSILEKLKKKNKIPNTGRNLKNYFFKKIGNKTPLTFFQTCSDLITVCSEDSNKLNELLKKFNSITITKKEIDDFISHLLSKLDFLRDQFNFFHLKELNLENKKSQYNKKVQDIISNHYFVFEEVTKNNSKCKKFLEKNEDFINKMKTYNKNKLDKKIIEKINQNDEIYKSEEDMINFDNDDIKVNTIDENDIVFLSAKKIIMNTKEFFFTCYDILKTIINKTNSNEDTNLKTDKKNNQNKTEENNELSSKENNNSEDKNNKFIQIYKKLDEFLKNKEIIITDDYKLLLQYIKDLINFCKENENIISKEDLDDINLNLYQKFYDPEKVEQKIDKLFMEQFLTKNSPNFNDIYTYFISLSDQVMENIKEIYDLIHSKENEEFLKENINSHKISDEDINLKNFPYTSKNNHSKETKKNKQKQKRKYTRGSSGNKSVISFKSNNIYGANKFTELSIDEEDNMNYENQPTKKKVVKKKRILSSVDNNVINRLYIPFLEKTTYLRKLNPNIQSIKQMTSSSSKAFYNIKKMIGKIDVVSNQMKIYNNPNLDVTQLCDNTYNSLVKLVYKITDGKKFGKRKYRLASK